MSELSHPSRRFLALPVETTTRSHRAAAEPIETTLKTNKKKTTSQNAGTSKGRAKDGRTVESPESTTKVGYGRFMPESAQTTTESTLSESAAGSTERGTETYKSTSIPIRIEPTTRRKFAPQLIETTRRSRRSGDPHRAVELYKTSDDDPPLLPHERTHLPPHHLGDGDDDGPPLLPHERTRPPPHRPRTGTGEMTRRRRPIPIPPANTRVPSSADILQYSVPRRTSSTHPHENTRRHSFVVPSLEPIISQPNSDESNCPSLSTSPSLSSETSSLADLRHYASGIRESGGERFSGYLLALAARAAEKQLREQAMAAYANDEYHEPVEHFANDRESDGSDADVLELELAPPRSNAGEDAVRRDTRDEYRREAREMRIHQTQFNQRRDGQKNYEIDSRIAKRSSKGHEIIASARLAATDASGAPKNIIGGWQKGVGLGPMRNAASPPMLGASLEFRLYYSPRQTTSELDHLSGPDASRNEDGGGLWMGLCSTRCKREVTTSRETPRPESTSRSPLSTIQARDTAGECNIEAEIDREFTDEFVTQVYNYLSLGYPCLARKFDKELSHVSGVPLEEISSSDSLADANGYVGLGEGVGVSTTGAVDSRCSRWKALRRYIREWAKQSPRMEQGGVGLDTWGVRARKGSWAI
jgi:hypothetical protein